MSPTVSIIIPCYRSEATITEAVESVVSQTFADWECILVSDDGQSYLDLLRRHGVDDPRILEHPERTNRTGTVAPRNRGMAMARGDFVADLDADDAWHPDRLEKLVPLADRHDVCFDVLECFSEGAGVLGWSGEMDQATVLLQPGDIVGFDFPFHVIARRAVLGDEWFWHDSVVPDVLRTAWLATRRPVCWLRAPMLRYRVSAGSMSQSMEGSKRIDADYGAIIDALCASAMPQIPERHRSAVVEGFERKRTLNRAYIEAASTRPQPPSFLEWVLATGRSGFRPLA